MPPYAAAAATCDGEHAGAKQRVCCSAAISFPSLKHDSFPARLIAGLEFECMHLQMLDQTVALSHVGSLQQRQNK